MMWLFLTACTLDEGRYTRERTDVKDECGDLVRLPMSEASTVELAEVGDTLVVTDPAWPDVELVYNHDPDAWRLQVGGCRPDEGGAEVCFVLRRTIVPIAADQFEWSDAEAWDADCDRWHKGTAQLSE